MTRYLAIAVALFCTSAEAQMRCGPHAMIVKGLQDKFSEARVARWSSETHVTEVWGNEHTGTWTLLQTRPNGMACITGMGRNFHNFEVLHKEGDET